jgi:hypothetical protein
VSFADSISEQMSAAMRVPRSDRLRGHREHPAREVEILLPQARELAVPQARPRGGDHEEVHATRPENAVAVVPVAYAAPRLP